MNPNEDPRVGDALEEQAKDQLVQLAGSQALQTLDVTARGNNLFFEWLARDVRLQQRGHARRASERAAQWLVHRILRRSAAAALRVRLVNGPPLFERRDVPAGVLPSVDLAAGHHMAPRVELAVAAGAGREIWDEPCTEWVRVPDELPQGRYLALTVAGDSMTPVFHSGDVILVRLGDTVSAGDVIVARCGEEGYVVKRLTRLTCAVVELESLNPAYASLHVPRHELSLVGSVVLRWCNHTPALSA